MTCSQMIDIEFKDLTYAVQIGYRRPKKEILKGLSGFFRSTELTAIIGPSGAGKTTLLNILSGFQKGSYKGKVEYYNKGDKQDWSSCKKQRCYIQQANYMHAFFTVHEMMTIVSYLKINRTISHESRQMLINDILNTLKLSYTKEIRVDRLSGGEKKRLSIALDLINNPPLMFLDEPTTGLDSLASIQCVTALKTLAQAGRTIICSIHQPSTTIYEIFDHIYLVVDGQCMYRSSPGDTVDYFARQGLQCPKHYNPADYMLEVVCKEYGNYDEQLIAAAKRPAKPNEETYPCTSSHKMIRKIDNNQTVILTNPPTELIRFWILLQRCAILMHRDPWIVYINLVIYFIVAASTSMICGNSGEDASKTIVNVKYIFSIPMYVYYSGMLQNVLKFSLEIDILRKECFNNWYQLKTYYVVMLICRIPLQIILSFVYSITTYLITKQPLEFSRFFMYLLINILSNLNADIMGLLLGVLLNPIHAILAVAYVTCLMTSFGGVIIFFRDMPRFLYYFSYLSGIQYSFNGLMQSIYGDHREKLFCPTVYCYFQKPSVILEELGLTKSKFWYDVVILLGYCTTFHIFTYMLLKKRLSKRY